MSKNELLEALRFGADVIFRSKDQQITDEDIDLILERGNASLRRPPSACWLSFHVFVSFFVHVFVGIFISCFCGGGGSLSLRLSVVRIQADLSSSAFLPSHTHPDIKYAHANPSTHPNPSSTHPPFPGRKRTAEITEKLQTADKGDLLDFRMDGGMSAQVFEGQDYSKGRPKVRTSVFGESVRVHVGVYWVAG